MWNKNIKKAAMGVMGLILAVSMEMNAYALPTLGAGNVIENTTNANSSVLLATVDNSNADTEESQSAETEADVTEKDATEVDAAEMESIDAQNTEVVQLAAGAANKMVVAGLSFEEDSQSDEDEDASGGSFGYTNLGLVQVDDHLNVRETPEDGSKIVGKMENNSGCEILGFEGNKAHITSGSVEGYVDISYLLMGDEAVKEADSFVKELATVSADGLKLRQQPSTDAQVVNMVAYGEQLEVVEQLDGWVGVDYDGQKVYVSSDYVDVDTKLKTALNMSEYLYGEGVSNVCVDLCEYAKQFIGNPYVWGGTSLTRGADCSGFVLSVYAKYGVSLPHSSRAQANCGTPVSMSEARPGDLVFYAKGKRINHVGIYIGGGQIVNASSPKTGIRISNVYYRTPVKVVRILQN